MKLELELVCTGNELLNGRVLNTHAQQLAQRVTAAGWCLAGETVVGDTRERIVSAIRDAFSRVRTVLVSGGLGPTTDDLTRQAVAGWLGRPVVIDGPSLAALERRYALFARPVTEAARRQALVVEGADVLPNRVGIAPGERLDTHQGRLYLLPGPPSEFLAILEDYVLPDLARDAGDPGDRRLARLLCLCGAGESDIAARIEEQGLPDAEIGVEYCARPGGVDLRLTAPAAAASRLDNILTRLRQGFGPLVFNETGATLEETVGALLRTHGRTLAVAESCTGGLLGGRITEPAGSSDYFLGGVIAYDNRVKVRELGVPEALLQQHGAVSAPVARAMARGVRQRFDADYGVSVTGIAGPSGGTPEKPVGTVWLGWADRQADRAVHLRSAPDDRRRVRERAIQGALDLVRRALIDPQPPATDG